MKKNEISQIGLKMMNWHSSQGDPIYAVGSFMFNGKLHTRETTARALDGIQNEIRVYDACPGVYGWTWADREELGEIAECLSNLLESRDLPTGAELGRVLP